MEGMIQRNGHFIQKTARNMTGIAFCLKCREEVSAINYDGNSDPSMSKIFEKRCRGEWKTIKSRLKAAIAEAEEALKMVKTCMALEREQRRRGPKVGDSG